MVEEEIIHLRTKGYIQMKIGSIIYKLNELEVYHTKGRYNYRVITPYGEYDYDNFTNAENFLRRY
jgi:hypothetical protein